MEVWPDNERALGVFRLVGTRWRFLPGGGMGPPPVVPIGLEWPSIYPLMDRQGLDADGWNALHGDLMFLEGAALEVMREFAPKSGEG